MRITHTRTAAAVTMLAAGVLSALALRAGSRAHSTSLAAIRQPPVEVRTQVIHRTVHIVRREHAAHPPASHTTAAGMAPPGSGSANGPASGSANGPASGSASARPRTAASGAGAALAPEPGSASTPAPPRTRTSGAGGGTSGAGSRPSSGPGAAPGGAVRTRTSGGAPTTSGKSSRGAARTRTSGSEGSGGHDD